MAHVETSEPVDHGRYRGYHVSQEDDLFVDADDSQEEEEAADVNGSAAAKAKDSKSKRKRNRKKKSSSAANGVQTAKQNGSASAASASDKENRKEDDINIEIEVVPEQIELGEGYAEFAHIFERFKFTEPEAANQAKEDEEAKKNEDKMKVSTMDKARARIFDLDEEEDKKMNEDSEKPKISKRQLKMQTRLSIATLKQLVNRPDLIEMHDVTAKDPKLLVDLKSTRNTVQVPRHWCAKRKYLQGKRGFEKMAFDLPDFIKRTGIQAMREAIHEKEANKSLKQKMRDKVRPKIGKIDIDYQKLHDAFFRYQTKPRMTIHGDLYYEGKELETRYKEKKPGNLSDDLRIALGMPIGAHADKVPPPWLIAMQRYGPPPSYPSLKIPGLNAPIPEGCSFGYHAGGWGKPPVDEFGRPLYGDVFGTSNADSRKAEEEEPVDQTLWGQIEEEFYEEVAPEEDSEEEEEQQTEAEAMEEESEEMNESDEAAGLKTPGEGLMTPSGISTTVSAGLETPDNIELRKRKQIEADMEGEEDRVLYKILPEKAASIGASMMGSSKVYDLSSAKKVHDLSGIASGIEMALNPDELEMDSELLQSRYDQQMRAQKGAGGGAGVEREDMSDMVADHAAKMKQKSKAKQAAAAAAPQEKDKNKKYKDFKF